MGNSPTTSSKDIRSISESHYDSMVMKFTITNYKIGRAFINTRSFINVMFYDCFLKLGTKAEDVTLASHSIIG